MLTSIVLYLPAGKLADRWLAYGEVLDQDDQDDQGGQENGFFILAILIFSGWLGAVGEVMEGVVAEV